MKYIGSKAKIAKYIVPILQSYIDKYEIKQYIEPFVGGFNVIDKINCEYRLGNDVDPLVCELVETVRNNPSLLDTLNTPTHEEYYDVRDNPKKYQTWYRAAILLFGSYNARVYGGCYGATALTKDGKIRDYFNEAKNNFRRQLPNLKNILIGCCDYRRLQIPKRVRTLIYCDPPYCDGIGYGHDFNTVEFWGWCRERTREGHIVVISESIAPTDFICVWQKEVTTHLDNNCKQKRTEKLFILEGGNGSGKW